MHFLRDLPDDPFTLAVAHERVAHLRGQILAGSPDPTCPTAGIVGLEELVERILIALLTGEHCLLEGNPGLAKTLASRTTGEMAGLVFNRIQMMPDTMPSELILKELLVYQGDRPQIVAKLGPVFANILLADEVNRASPKVSAALLEATEEKHVTPLNRPRRVIRPVEPRDEARLMRVHGPFYGEPKYDPDTTQGQVFTVLATQNPIEQEGVYPLSKAQEDRFLFKLMIPYPTAAQLEKIAGHAFDQGGPRPRLAIGGEDHVRTLYFFTALRRRLLGPDAKRRWEHESNRGLRERVEALINFSHYRSSGANSGRTEWTEVEDGKQDELRKILADWTRKGYPRADRFRALTANPDSFPEVASGSSPRGLLKLIRAAHVRAFLDRPPEKGTDFVTPTWEDFAALAHDVLRHRIRLAPGAEAAGARSDTVIDRLVEWLGSW
jgi:MoxR-like ATPase